MNLNSSMNSFPGAATFQIQNNLVKFEEKKNDPGQ